jgi:type II secretory ATPase GspE/PulE/Tfp pilus assembly ATPase PilB-like protein
MSAAVQDFSSPELAIHTPEQAVAALLERASRLHASDLFLAGNPDGVDVSVRHLGILRPLARLPLELGHRCIAHVGMVHSRVTLARARFVAGNR